MYDNGQIATKYADLNGISTMILFIIRMVPLIHRGYNQSDGRIFGKMGHSERIGKNLYKNITGNMEQKIFESGIKYFL